MAFQRLEALINLYDGYRKVFNIHGHSLILLQEDGRRYLILNQCPHRQAPLDRGSISGGYIRCPVHGIEFNLDSGRAKSGCTAELQYISLQYDEKYIGITL